ncbi:MAG: tRNA (N(6)-L-threonylcarbamoyladenosine(37)-C(2))-methylthiotransferase MtaB [Candidatus Rokuibacteriota bacterium]|nr:MAG: tRNA (N(6)-L-threonylcarbamoyladenosine(37)-C(2))-methylthiotransferase MtaB [Candidatus Rokubacteria bacterium]
MKQEPQPEAGRTYESLLRTRFRAMTTVALATLGCRVNQVDTQEMQGRLEALGCRTVPFDSLADVVIINTCTVTSRADFSDRQLIRRAIRANPNARVVVTGCWAQTNPGAVAAIPGVDLVVGAADRHRIGALLDGLGKAAEARVEVGDMREGVSMAPAPAPRVSGRSRAFVKIQDGCQHRCAFCIVPYARGASRSRERKVIADQVRERVEAGHPEVVLTGIDMGNYGADLFPRTTLAALLRDLAMIAGLRWLRLSSVLPAYFGDDLIDALTSLSVIVPHLHVPLQSGSDRVLRSMRRPYNTMIYTRLVEKLAERIPGLGLGTDLIVGFPGETEEDFALTERLVTALPFSAWALRPSTGRGTCPRGRLPAEVGGCALSVTGRTSRSASGCSGRRRKSSCSGRGIGSRDV